MTYQKKLKDAIMLLLDFVNQNESEDDEMDYKTAKELSVQDFFVRLEKQIVDDKEDLCKWKSFEYTCTECWKLYTRQLKKKCKSLFCRECTIKKNRAQKDKLVDKYREKNFKE